MGKNVLSAEVLVVNKRSNRVGSRNLHLLVDVAGSAVERAAENTGEGENVIDLVRKVASACADNSRTCFFREVGHNFGSGVSHSKENRILSHRLDHILAYAACGGDSEEHVRTLHSVGESTCLVVEIGDFSHLALDGV